MTDIIVAPIVEGFGEVEALRTLLDRTWREVLGGEYLEVLRPIRQPRSKLVQHIANDPTPNQANIERAVRLAAAKLGECTGPDAIRLILLLLDADTDCPARLAPELLKAMHNTAPASRCAVVLANVEYETWFVAAAESLRDFLHVDNDAPEQPEKSRSGKRWIETRLRGVKYSETLDQVRLSAVMDLHQCRTKSPSFDKLCRELEKCRQ